MTAALEGGEWSAARPGRTLPSGKTRYPFYRRLGGPQGRSGRAEDLVPTGIRSRTVQPVVSRYTDWATRPTLLCSIYALQTGGSSGYWSIKNLTCRILEFIDSGTRTRDLQDIKVSFWDATVRRPKGFCNDNLYWPHEIDRIGVSSSLL